jgi:hypothetical protein
VKASRKYESAAQILALIGALALGCAGFPCLNPIQFKFMVGEGEGVAVRHMILVLPIAVLTLVAAWKLTSKANELKREEERDPTKEPER